VFESLVSLLKTNSLDEINPAVLGLPKLFLQLETQMSSVLVGLKNWLNLVKEKFN
jgi:hypothetical protein